MNSIHLVGFWKLFFFLTQVRPFFPLLSFDFESNAHAFFSIGFIFPLLHDELRKKQEQAVGIEGKWNEINKERIGFVAWRCINHYFFHRLENLFFS